MSRFSSSLQARLSLFAQNPTRRCHGVGRELCRPAETQDQSVDQKSVLGGFKVERGSGSVCDGGELWCFAARLGEQCDGQLRSLALPQVLLMSSSRRELPWQMRPAPQQKTRNAKERS